MGKVYLNDIDIDIFSKYIQPGVNDISEVNTLDYEHLKIEGPKYKNSFYNTWLNGKEGSAELITKIKNNNREDVYDEINFTSNTMYSVEHFKKLKNGETKSDSLETDSDIIAKLDSSEVYYLPILKGFKLDEDNNIARYIDIPHEEFYNNDSIFIKNSKDSTLLMDKLKFELVRFNDIENSDNDVKMIFKEENQCIYYYISMENIIKKVDGSDKTFVRVYINYGFDNLNILSKRPWDAKLQLMDGDTLIHTFENFPSEVSASMQSLEPIKYGFDNLKSKYEVTDINLFGINVGYIISSKLSNESNMYYHHFEIVIFPYAMTMPRQNENGEYLYVDAGKKTVTQSEYNNNFYAHQKMIRRAFNKIFENTGWQYDARVKEKEMVLLQKGSRYQFAGYYYDTEETTYEYLSADDFESLESTPDLSQDLPTKDIINKISTANPYVKNNKTKRIVYGDFTDEFPRFITYINEPTEYDDINESLTTSYFKSAVLDKNGNIYEGTDTTLLHSRFDKNYVVIGVQTNINNSENIVLKTNGRYYRESNVNSSSTKKIITETKYTTDYCEGFEFIKGSDGYYLFGKLILDPESGNPVIYDNNTKIELSDKGTWKIKYINTEETGTYYEENYIECDTGIEQYEDDGGFKFKNIIGINENNIAQYKDRPIIVDCYSRVAVIDGRRYNMDADDNIKIQIGISSSSTAYNDLTFQTFTINCPDSDKPYILVPIIVNGIVSSTSAIQSMNNYNVFLGTSTPNKITTSGHNITDSYLRYRGRQLPIYTAEEVGYEKENIAAGMAANAKTDSIFFFKIPVDRVETKLQHTVICSIRSSEKFIPITKVINSKRRLKVIPNKKVKTEPLIKNIVKTVAPKLLNSKYVNIAKVPSIISDIIAPIRSTTLGSSLSISNSKTIQQISISEPYIEVTKTLPATTVIQETPTKATITSDITGNSIGISGMKTLSSKYIGSPKLTMQQMFSLRRDIPNNTDNTIQMKVNMYSINPYFTLSYDINEDSMYSGTEDANTKIMYYLNPYTSDINKLYIKKTVRFIPGSGSISLDLGKKYIAGRQGGSSKFVYLYTTGTTSVYKNNLITYRFASKYFTDKMMDIRGDAISEGVFYKNKLNSLKNSLKSLIKGNKDEKLNIKKEYSLNDGKYRMYNYATAVSNLIIRNYDIESDEFIDINRRFFDINDFDYRVILNRTNYEDIDKLNSELLNISNITRARSFFRKIIERHNYPIDAEFEVDVRQKTELEYAMSKIGELEKEANINLNFLKVNRLSASNNLFIDTEFKEREIMTENILSFVNGSSHAILDANIPEYIIKEPLPQFQRGASSYKRVFSFRSSNEGTVDDIIRQIIIPKNVDSLDTIMEVIDE